MADISSNMFDSLLKQVQDYSPTVESVEVGYVDQVGDGIARVSGLENIRFSELVRFSNGAAGIAFNLEKDNVGVIIMGEYDTINEGDEVRPLGRIASVPVGMGLVGRVVNALGEPVDGRGPIASTEFYNIERIAPCCAALPALHYAAYGIPKSILYSCALSGGRIFIYGIRGA